MEDRVLEQVEANPGISIRKVTLRKNVPKSSICEILYQQLLWPYHLQRVQQLKPQDLQPRLEYSQSMRMQFRQSRNFLVKVLFTDEAGVTREGTVTFHNNYIWAEKNPKAIFEVWFHNRFAANVCAGILGEQLIGLYVIPNRRNNATIWTFPKIAEFTWWYALQT